MTFTPVPKGRSRFEEKVKQRVAELRNERSVSVQVDHRDGYRCRVCQRSSNINGVGLLERGHRHHIDYRSAGGLTTTANMCHLCSRCHAAIHAGDLRLSGDADQRDPITGKLNGLKVEKRTESGWTTARWV